VKINPSRLLMAGQSLTGREFNLPGDSDDKVDGELKVEQTLLAIPPANTLSTYYYSESIGSLLVSRTDRVSSTRKFSPSPPGRPR